MPFQGIGHLHATFDSYGMGWDVMFPVHLVISLTVA